MIDHKQINKPNNLTLSPQEVILRRAIPFDPEDLMANQSGTISENQRQRLIGGYKKKLDQWIFWLGISFLATILIFLLIIFFRYEGPLGYFRDLVFGRSDYNRIPELLIGFLAAGLFLIIILTIISVILWTKVKGISTYPQVNMVQGRLKKMRAGGGDSSYEFNILSIGQKKLICGTAGENDEVFDAFIEDQNYRIFYLQALGKEILSVEII